MTREELDKWNVCIERPDAMVMKDIIFDHFEQRIKELEAELEQAKDSTMVLQGSYTRWESIAYSMQEKVKELEAELEQAKDLRHNAVLISQDDVDFLQEQNQRYAYCVEELEAKLKKYEEPVAKFKGTAFDECQDITLYSNDRGRLVVDMYMTLGMEDEKEYEVIIIEADK